MTQQLLTTSEPPVVSRIDRRASTRYPCNLSTSCRMAALVSGDPVPGRVRNISAGGISLVLGHPVDSGDELTVELRSTFRQFSRTMHIRAAYCVEHPSGDWIVGAAFVQPLTEEEVRMLLT